MAALVPISATTPAAMSFPSSFADVEARLAARAQVIETHLKSLSLWTLQEIQSAANLGIALPHGLETVRQEVLDFLAKAIAIAQDVITIVQMLGQLSAIEAVPVA